MSVAHFAGRVLGCCTRFSVKKPTTAYVTHFDANWILTLEITAAGEGLPFAAGAEQAFAIHSPVQLLFDSTEECVGKHYEMVVDVDDATRVPRWQTLRRR